MSLNVERQHYVRELTMPISHRERRQIPQHNGDGTITWIRQDHITTHPSLIDQLDRSGDRLTNTGEDGRGTFGSSPAARLEALDELLRIDHAAARWVRQLGRDDPGDTVGCILILNGLAAALDECPRVERDKVTKKVICCDLHKVDADVRSWWTRARIVTGWDLPAWKPANSCPLCNERGSLRIKIIDQSGMCVACDGAWTQVSIGLLADHIRAENDDPEEAVGEVVA